MNVVIYNQYFRNSDQKILFGDEPCYMLDSQVTLLPNLLVALGLYKNTSVARRAGRSGEIPKGWSEIQGNKLTKVWIWNPSM
jgi:hypothetical protein